MASSYLPVLYRFNAELYLMLGIITVVSTITKAMQTHIMGRAIETTLLSCFLFFSFFAFISSIRFWQAYIWLSASRQPGMVLNIAIASSYEAMFPTALLDIAVVYNASLRQFSAFSRHCAASASASRKPEMLLNSSAPLRKAFCAAADFIMPHALL